MLIKESDLAKGSEEPWTVEEDVETLSFILTVVAGSKSVLYLQDKPILFTFVCVGYF